MCIGLLARIIVAVGLATTLLACTEEPSPEPIVRRYLTVAAAEADEPSPIRARWIHVIDVSEPGNSGAQTLVAEAEERFRRIETASTGAIGVFETFADRVFVHDFARAPLVPAHELHELPVAPRSNYVFAPDDSGLIVRSEVGGDERGRLDYVGLNANGPTPAVELQFPSARWASEAFGFTPDGNWLVALADNEANEASGVYAFALDDGRAAPPITLVEPGERRLSSVLNVVGEYAFFELYDTSWDDPESRSTIMRVDISALPTVELEPINQPVPRSSVVFWVLGDGARLIHRYEPETDGLGHFELIEIDEDGPMPAQLLALPGEDLLLRDFSSDGRWVAFRSSPGLNPTTLYVFDFEDDTPTEPMVIEDLPGSLTLNLDLGWMGWHDNYETSFSSISKELGGLQLFRSDEPWQPAGIEFDAHAGRVTLVERYPQPDFWSASYVRLWTRSADSSELGPLWRISKPSWFEPHAQWPVFVPADDRHFVAIVGDDRTAVWENDGDGNDRILFEHAGEVEIALWSPR